MALSNDEIALLTTFFNNHGIVTYVFPTGENNRLNNVQQWLNTIPNVTDFDDNNPFTGIKQVLHALTFSEKKDIFSYNDATHWYRQILTDISEGIITDKLAKKYIDIFSQKSNNSRLLTFAFNEFLSKVVSSKDIDFLNQIFYIMLKQGLISQLSLNRVGLEFLPSTRYLSIGLSELPDLTELESIIGL